MVKTIKDILDERGTRYGVFMGQAKIAQSIHWVLEQGMAENNKSRFDFEADQLEAMNMIINKIARIYNGDPNYSDSWRDIAGYATLVADRLDNENEIIEITEDNNNDRTRDNEYAETNRGGDEPTWEQDAERQSAIEDVNVDSRPTGQPELRGMPIELEVQDGIHTSESTEN